MLGNATVKTTIAVTNLERAKKFYGQTLGMNYVGTSLGDETKDALFEAGHGSQVYLYVRGEPAGSTATTCSFEVDDVEGTVKNLQSKGVKFEEYDVPEMGLKTKNGVAKMGDVTGAWFKDPDGNILAVANSPNTSTKSGTAQTQTH